MKILTTLILLFGIFLTHPALGFNPFEGKYRISTSESAHVYEMKTCIQGEEVEGCRGIILKNVELIGPLGHTKKIKHLFLRNLRSDETGEPVSKSCLNRYVGKMNKYLGVKSIMKGFSKRPQNLWRDPVDDTQFSMPTFMENTRVDANGSSYGLPVDKKTIGLSFKEPGGMNCSFSISMGDHIEDRPKEEPFKFEPIVTSDIIVTKLPPLKEEKKEELDIIFSNENIQDGEKEEGETLKEEEHKEEPCEKHTPEGGDVLSIATQNLTEEWEEIKPAVFEKKILMNADITYSFMKANIADATISLDTIDDKIDYISMKGVYDVLGMNGEVGYGFSIDEIKRGKSLSFYADYNSEPILKITPNPGFNENDGGAIRFQFWDGKKYQNLNGHLARDHRGEFKLFIKNVQPANEVSYLRVNVRGMSPGSMRIKEYEVQ